MIENNRRQEIIKETQKLIQIKGFKEFSISQVAKKLDIHKSSILHYFKNGEELLKESLKAYRASFLEELEEIKNEKISLKNKLKKYIKIHEEVLLNRKKICLCAALGSDFPSLPQSIQNQILIHIRENKNYILDITSADLGQENLKEKSNFFVNSLQGLMMVCRNEDDLKEFYEGTNLLIETLYGL